MAGASYDLDFDHQFIETDKYDAKMTYKKFTGYSPGVAVIGDLTWCKGSMGDVRVSWHLDGDTFILQADIPEGHTATITLPYSHRQQTVPPGAGSDTCPGYRSDKTQRIPRGMTHFYEAMTRHMEIAIKSQLINHFSRVTYYRYRRGEYPITPKIEQKITEVCRECGWTAPLTFDTYSDELVW